MHYTSLPKPASHMQQLYRDQVEQERKLQAFLQIGSIALQKAEELGLLGDNPEDMEKGRPAMPIGAKATWAGVDYIKTASGWKPVGKLRGHVKANHDFIHKNEEKDKDHHTMVLDAGKMSADEWAKKHGSHLHGKYKEVHDYLHKPKGEKKVEPVEGGAVNESNYKQLGYTVTIEPTEIFGDKGLRVSVGDKKMADTDDPNGIFDDTAYRLEDSGSNKKYDKKEVEASLKQWAFKRLNEVHSEKNTEVKKEQPAKPAEKKEEPKPEGKSAKELFKDVHVNDESRYFGSKVHVGKDEESMSEPFTGTLQRVLNGGDMIEVTNDKGQRVRVSPDIVTVTDLKDSGSKEPKEDPDKDFKMTVSNGKELDLRRDVNHEDYKDISPEDHKAVAARHSKLAHTKGGDLSSYHNAQRFAHEKAAQVKLTPKKEEVKKEEPAKAETNPETGKQLVKDKEQHKKLLLDHFASGGSAKDFLSKYEFGDSSSATANLMKRGKIDHNSGEVIGDGVEVKAAEIPVKVKPAKSAADVLAGIPSKDTLRPAMTGICYSKGLAAATDAHKLIVTKSDDKEKDGKVINPKTGEEIKGVRYPDYPVIIPQYDTAVKDVDVNDLMAKLNGLSEGNKVFEDPAIGVAAVLKIDGNDISFNPSLLLDSLKAIAKTGAKKVHISGHSQSRGIVISEDAGKAMAVVMPMYDATFHRAFKTVLEGKSTSHNAQFVKDVIRRKDFSNS